MYAKPSRFPKFCSNVELASTIKASIKTCLVLLSISLITLSTISKSFSFPLTIIDLVVASSVTCIGMKFPLVPTEVNSSVIVAWLQLELYNKV